MLELGEDLLDGVEVGTVGRQDDEMRASRPDSGFGFAALVGAEVIETDDITRLEGRGEDMLDMSSQESWLGESGQSGSVDFLPERGMMR